MYYAELIEFKNQKPHLYIDMDGVLADFFGAWAERLGGEPGSNWEYIKTLPAAEHSNSIRKLSQHADFVTDFFANLKPLSGGKRIIELVRQNHTPFTILSAPLHGRNSDASIAGKKQWLAQHNLEQVPAIFTQDKYLYAKQPNGKPNILIDDYGKNITAWREHGGIAIKHDDSTTGQTLKLLSQYLS